MESPFCHVHKASPSTDSEEARMPEAKQHVRQCDQFELALFNPGSLTDEDVNGLYWMLHQERRLRGITSSNLWPVFSRDPVAMMLDRAIRALRVRGAALELVRAEVDLPEHVAEAVGNALAKGAASA